MSGSTPNYHWTLPTIGGDASSWGSELNADLGLIDGQVKANENAIAAINARFSTSSVDVVTTTGGALVNWLNGNTGFTPRWSLLDDGSAETGGNAGSNFNLQCYNDAGAYLSSPMSFVRSTGSVTFSGVTASFNGSVACYGGLATTSLSCAAAASFSSTLTVSGTATFAGGVANINALTTSGTATFAGGLVNINALTTTAALSLNNSGGFQWGVLSFDQPSSNFAMNNTLTGVDWVLGSAAASINVGNVSKPGGGPWSATSDARIKDVIGEYETGLDEVIRLKPVTFTYKGNDAAAAGSPSLHAYAAREGTSFVGLVADDAMLVMPEMVSLHDGYIDGVKVTDLKQIDTTALIYALVNSCRELAARVQALESKET